ncbi:amidase family protein [Tsuneonella sp. YG55]|uniref:Amidase family protein n=1 Tax=Tsuneonella litorea TaxID=2976475 RepID=A0A9X3AN26_9SPHN|nr:amidase family protein [Tsuneonella litorea]MCT2559112.1 amidase family protein [Tsuneonella litorea]
MIPKLTDEPTAIALAAQIAARELSPLEAVDACIARIEALDGPLNAVVVRDFDRARDVARALDGETPGDRALFGVPMTVKESFNVAGLPTTFGHLEFKDFVPQRDSRVVERLKAAGAVIVGKTNVPPDLADLQSNNPVYGRTNNPFDHSRVSGGSSGGSAVAVASGMVPVEYGTDIGSSVRNPAHFNGIFGHKTTFGLVSRRGHTSPAAAGRDVHEGPLSVPGPLARSADDLALLLDLTAERPLARNAKPLAELRFLAVLDHPVSEIDASVRGPIETALAEIERAGARVERSSELLPDLALQHSNYLRLLNVAMARGQPAPDGTAMSLPEYYLLLDEQARCRFSWADLLAAYDFVLAPPLPFVAYPHDATPIRDRRITINGKDSAFGDALAWAGLATFPNLPSTVVPVGESGGLPCGMQVIGREWADMDCIAAAGAIGRLMGA